MNMILLHLPGYQNVFIITLILIIMLIIIGFYMISKTLKVDRLKNFKFISLIFINILIIIIILILAFYNYITWVYL